MAGSASGDDTPRAVPEPPPTPAGYEDPYRFEYSTVAMVVLSLPILVLTGTGFGWVLWELQGPAVFAAVFDVTETGDVTTVALDLVVAGGPFVLALVVTVVAHELLHGAVMHYYGQEVTYGVNPAMGAFYAAAFGQFQTREQLFPIALAPLVGITLVGVPLLAVPVPPIALTAYFTLVINATGAVGDLYVLWRVWRLPDESLVYDADLRHWYVYEPRASDGPADRVP